MFLLFFCKTDFYELIHTFLDLKQLFFIFPLNFPNGVIIFTLVDIGREKSKKSYPLNQVTRLTNIWLYCGLYGL